MQKYSIVGNEKTIFNDHETTLVSRVLEELQSSPSRVRDYRTGIYSMAGDCGSCPGCGCINQGVQFLAVIEAPATVPIMVAVGAIRIAS